MIHYKNMPLDRHVDRRYTQLACSGSHTIQNYETVKEENSVKWPVIINEEEQILSDLSSCWLCTILVTCWCVSLCLCLFLCLVGLVDMCGCPVDDDSILILSNFQVVFRWNDMCGWKEGRKPLVSEMGSGESLVSWCSVMEKLFCPSAPIFHVVSVDLVL